MKILVINGNTKLGGFTAGVLSIISSYLEAQGIEVQNIRLHDADIKDCIGCFHCLKTGSCVLTDDMAGIIQAMLKADGFVIGSPVRNGLTTACYKRFHERITYTLGFTLLLEDKYTLAISSVGYMGGRRVNKRVIGLQDICHARLSDFIFYKVGVPTKINPDDIRIRLEEGAKKLISDINTRAPRRLLKRILFAVDRTVMRKCMFEKNPEQYANAIKCWREKGYM
jgi:multimeric flavodoxin WrbA